VGDDRFGTVDWVNRQSSLNGFQAKLGKDGKFRAIVSARDPGVANWLDTAGNPWDMMQVRWNRCNDAPRPTVARVAPNAVRDSLPKDTPVAAPTQRKAGLALRREGAHCADSGNRITDSQPMTPENQPPGLLCEDPAAPLFAT